MCRIWKAAVILCAAAMLTGCAPQDASYERTEELFGTFVSAKIYCDDAKNAQAALDAAFARAGELECIFSPNIADSELNAVNAAAYAQDTAVSEDFLYLLEQSLYFTELTDGAFDCRLGELIDLWGIGTESAKIPTETECRNALLPSGDTTVSIHADGTVRFLDERVQLQFGAIAKGYIADEMKAVLDSFGIESGTLSLGGNVLTLGEKPSGDAWTVGITDPFSPGELYATVRVKGKSVVTSGNYERYFEENGVRYHHIFDPETGFPADAGLVSTTIIADSSLLCDALSTATYVLGAEEGMALIEQLDGAEAVFLTEDGEILTSSGMAEYELKQVTK